MKKTHAFAISIATDITVVDQVTKWLASEYLMEPYDLFPGAALEYTENTGVAFSLPVPFVLLIPISIIMVLGIIFYANKHLKMDNKIAIFAIGAIIGGAVGNIIDRIIRGYVVDFIKIGWWPTFNLADTFLVIGVFLLIVFYGKISRSEELSESNQI